MSNNERHIDRAWMREIRDKANEALAHTGQTFTWTSWTDSNINNKNLHVGYDSIIEMRQALDRAWEHRPTGHSANRSDRGNCSYCTHNSGDRADNSSNKTSHYLSVKASNRSGVRNHNSSY